MATWKSEVKFDILEHKGVIREKNEIGWRKEANVVSWNGGVPKLDIREWDDSHDRLTRGITLYEEDGIKAIDILREKLPSEEEFPTETSEESTEVTYKICMHLGVICTQARKSDEGEPWSKEINIDSWNGGVPKVDIRDWNESHTMMGRGITLFREEAVKLSKIDPKFGEEVRHA